MSSTDPGSSKSSTSSKDSGRVAYLDQALWHRFTEASTADNFATAWLTLQVSMLDKVTRGVVVLGPAERGPFVPAAGWPEGDEMPATLSHAAESAMVERRGVVNRASQGEQPSQLAYPLLVDNHLFGVVALEFSDCDEAQLLAIMRRLQWGCGWLEAYLRRADQGSSAGSRERLSRLLQLTATALEQKRFRAAAMALVTELAIQTGCDRVGLGLRSGKHTKVYAVSHTAQFGEQTNLVRAITGAMDEAIDQLETVLYPQAEDGRLVTRAHSKLAESSEADAICTVVMSSGDRVLGALSFEHTGGKSFDAETIELLEHAGALLGPLLEIKRRDDRWIITKVAESMRDLVIRLVGPKHYATKLIGLLLAGLFVFLSMAEGDYRVSADAVLEGSVQRVVVAPINGYISEAQARAGDVVEQDQVLFSIDDRDLRLEYLKWTSQKEQVDRRYRDALAAKNRSEVNIFKAQLDQAEAQLELLEEQIARTQVAAPFDGVVVSGDLSQRLGSPVSRGEVLLNIAPLDAYRVVLQVDERNIADLEQGQVGQLILKALPRDQFPFVVEKITPVSEAMEGRNRFRVEARLTEGMDLLRPGMEGSGKIMIDRRSLQWIWTHDIVEWFKLWFWYWWP
ncbi:MAG: HlyD family efflux transporter periplasmic adaptor subunit [Gammaproteobacteria bacterium]|nr:HlyD family efflux transporter periplasmic adaptor subunit [Gammaproteobacteria bacterium]